MDVVIDFRRNSTICVVYISSPPANLKNSRIIVAILKRLCMILYTLKYASQTHSKHSLTYTIFGQYKIVNFIVHTNYD